MPWLNQTPTSQSYPGHSSGEFRNSSAFAALKGDGTVVTWGDSASGGDSSAVASQLTGVRQVFSTKSAFAALKSDGTVVTWGNSLFGGDSHAVTDQLTGVQQVFSTGYAFAALKADGTVVAWGDVTYGGNSSAVTSQLAGVRQVFSTEAAFAALKDDGSVVTWGFWFAGGDTSGVSSQLVGVQQVASTDFSFAALKSDGTVVSWGNSSSAGDSSAVASQLTGVQQIVSAQSAFAALKADGTVVTWGQRSWGGDSSAMATQLTGVQQIVASTYAFAALKGDGTVVTWGDQSEGGNSSAVASQLTGVTQISSNSSAFAALKGGGTVVTWGNGFAGGDSSGVSSQLVDVHQIVSNSTAFAALRSDGTVVTWGAAGQGGGSSAVASQLVGVQQVFAARNAFAALKADGTVVTWGESNSGGNSSAVARQLTDVVGINTILTDDDWQPVARPVISGIPLEVQFTTVGVPTALADFTVADADSNLLTVSLASTNGTLDNLVDADVGTPGTQLSGTAAIINAAIAGAGFTVTAAGAADIRVSVHDGDVLNPVTRSYNLFAGERTLQGSPQGDILTGGSSADILNGAGGNDILIGGGGGDRLDGGEGDDYAGYTGSSGVFAHLTWAVNNSGDAAGDTYVGIEGLIGSGHDDLLAGNEANNTLVGNAGNDWLFGREGLDYLLGGEGNDVLSGGPGNDLLDGGAGDDVAYYGDAAPTTYYVSLHGFKTGMDNGRTYGISLDLGNPINNFGEAAFDQLVNIENLWGSPFDDIIRGADDVGGQAYGFGGNDYLFGGGGADVLDGGTGDDTLDLTRHVGLAVDTAAGGAGADRFVLDGNSRAVITDFATGVGGDTLDLNAALASSTDYSGGNPFDAALVYFRVAQDGANALMQWDSDGAAGAANWVTLATIQNTDAVAASQSTSLDITPPTLIGLSPPDGSTSVAAESNFYLTFDEPVVAGSGNIVIYNADGTVAQTIAVTDSTQVAAHGNTVIINPGSNLTDGRSYYINVDAGAVQDLVGQRFAGFSDASTFNFSVYGDDFANRVTDTSHPFGVLPVGSSASGDIGIAGDIDLFRVDLDAWLTYTFELKGASTGSGTLYDPYLRLLNSTGDLLASDDDSGFALDSLLTAAVVTSGTYYLDVRHFSNGTGTYVLSVVRDGITLDGTSADDLLNGGTGNDQLRGLAGNDTLNGGPGADQLTGGVGADVLTGGAGADSFFYLSHNDHLNASGVLELWDGGDTITDFQHGVDHIVVSRYWFGFGNIGGPAAALTTQHADFITNGSAPTQARPTFTYDAATSQLHFDGDGSGATAAVLMATLQAGATFTLSDIWTA